MKDLNERLERALGKAIDHLGGDAGTIHLKEPDRMVLRLGASRAIPDSVLSAIQEIPWGKGMAGLAAQRAEPVDSCNLQESESTDIQPGARATGVRGSIVVPMMHGSEVVGTIGIGTQAERSFSAEETKWLMDFGRKLARKLGATTTA